jgi:hypothetical protein
MKMTPHILFSCARKALKLSRECKREGEALESIRHRERAAWYLSRRKMLLRDLHSPKLERAA